MAAISGVSQQSMGKDEFLKLFTTQARMQDPMNPVQSSDFLAQLAQFSSLEQMSNLNTSFEKMLSSQQTLEAGQFLGKAVIYQDPSDESATPGQGYVTGVKLTDSGPVLLVGNTQVPLSWVSSMYDL